MTASVTIGSERRSTSSRTRTNGRVRVESAEPRRESTLRGLMPVGDAMASNTPGSMLSTRSSATETCPRKTTGSPSASSIETHANGRRSRSAHSASRVVLP